MIYRSDASGTTQNFEKYLAANDPTDFTATPGEGQRRDGVQGPGQGEVAGRRRGHLPAPRARSATTSTPSRSAAASRRPRSTTAAARWTSPRRRPRRGRGAAKVVGTGDDLSLKLDYATKTAGAYPIILVTYEIVCSKYKTPAIGTFVKNFLDYTANGGQTALAGLGYAPLPTALQTKVNASIAKIA